MRKIIAVVLLLAVIAGVIAAVVIMGGAGQSAEQKSNQSKTYVALGDSVAAGVGLKPYSDASACDRTDQSYPVVFAQKEGYMLTNLACSGATIPAGIEGAQVVNNLSLDAQLAQLFARNETPDLITLTIGANDIGWTDFLACYSSECSADLKLQAVPRYTEFRRTLTSVLDAIKQRYGTSLPRVALTGYYQVIPADGATCDETNGLTVNERVLLTDIFNELNNSIKDVSSRYEFVTYVPIDFTGHELCSRTPWVQGFNAKAPFHPTAEGQAAIVKQLVGSIRLKK